MKQVTLESKNCPFVMKKRFDIGLKVKLGGLIYVFKMLDRIAPFLADRLALKLFLRPPRHVIPQ